MRKRKITRHRARRASKRVRAQIARIRKQRKQLKRQVWAVYNRRHRSTYAQSLANVPSRDEIPELLNRRGLVGDAAEIGVKTGKYSDLLLTGWRGRRLISIDPWLEAAQEDYVDRANVPQDQHEQFYARTKERLAHFGNRSEIWRLKSLEAAERIADRSLDFVYIDARHDYESVLEDLEGWFSKVKVGGIIAGHDYVNGSFPSGVFGVKRAVDEFFAERHLSVHSTQGPSPVEMFPSWLVEVDAR